MSSHNYNEIYLDQSHRNIHNPLPLGRFDQTSLRLLQGEFRNLYKPTGVPAYNADLVRNATPYGVGGGTRSAFFEIELAAPAWVLVAKGGQFPNYIQTSVYTSFPQPLQGRAIHDADSITIEGESRVYIPFLDTVFGTQSDLYNYFNPDRLDNGNTTYYPLTAGKYIICISTLRTEPINYEVGLVIEFSPDEIFIICEDTSDIEAQPTFIVQQDFFDKDTPEGNLGIGTEIILGTDGNPKGEITTDLTLDELNYWSQSGIGINTGTTVTIDLGTTWMIAPKEFDIDDPQRILCNYDQAYLDSVHDRDLRTWRDAWFRDNVERFPDLFLPYVNLPEFPRLEELPIGTEELIRTRLRNLSRNTNAPASSAYSAY